MVRNTQQAQVESDREQYIARKAKAKVIIARINRQSADAVALHLESSDKDRGSKPDQPKPVSPTENKTASTSAIGNGERERETEREREKERESERETRRLRQIQQRETQVCHVPKCWSELFTICPRCDMNLCWAHGYNTPWTTCKCTTRPAQQVPEGLNDEDLLSFATAFNTQRCAKEAEKRKQATAVKTSVCKPTATVALGRKDSDDDDPGANIRLNPNHNTNIGRTTSRTHDVGGPTHKRTHTNTTQSASTGRKSVGRPTASDFFDFEGRESGSDTLSNVSGNQPLTLSDTENQPLSLSDVSGRQPLTLSDTGRQPLSLSDDKASLSHASNRAALVADPAKEADPVQTVVCPNTTQEGCAKARLSNHPNEMGSAKSQLGHKHIKHKHKDDWRSNGRSPPKPDPLKGMENRTKPANIPNTNIQHRGRTQPQPVHLNQTQPSDNSVTAKFD